MLTRRGEVSIQDMVPYRLPRFMNKHLIDPHVVIVGAGASIAACEVDKNGKKVGSSSPCVKKKMT